MRAVYLRRLDGLRDGLRAFLGGAAVVIMGGAIIIVGGWIFAGAIS